MQYQSSVPSRARKRGCSSASACSGLNAARSRPGLRHARAPEVIVERQIEQRAVQIEQHGFDPRPVGRAQDRGVGWAIGGGVHAVGYHKAYVGSERMTVSAEQLSAWLPAVMDIADAAGREIMRIYQAGFSVTLKDDRSPRTEADLAAQRVIDAGLRSLTPQWPMLGEESLPEVFAQRRAWQTLWLVDPLDGTREFVKRNGEFSVNIALVQTANRCWAWCRGRPARCCMRRRAAAALSGAAPMASARASRCGCRPRAAARARQPLVWRCEAGPQARGAGSAGSASASAAR